MKKLIMILSAFFAMCGGAAAQEVAVAPVEALPGETVSLTMRLDTDGGSYTGLEFDILFPGEGFTTTGMATITAAWDGAFTIGDVGGIGINYLARCGVLSYSDTAIPGDGLQKLGTVQFTVGASVALGNYTIILTNMTLVGDGRVPVPDATFTLNVVSRHTVILDEDATTAPEAAEGVNVRVLRTIVAGNWSTICLPFSMTEEQTKEAFGNDVQLADFTGYEVREDGDGNVNGIKVNFETVTAIEANHPYIIKVSSPVTEFTVEDVDIEPEEEPTNAVIKRTRKQWSEMIGTYVAETTVEENMLFISGGKFWYSVGLTKMKGYRAYFDFYDVLTEVEEAGVRMIVSIDEEETGIVKFGNGLSATDNVFDLTGRKVSKSQHGVYIVNGKKMLKK